MYFILSEHGSTNSVELDAHFRFQYESFKNQFDGILYLFYNFQMSTVTANGNELSWIIKRTEHCKFCMQIASLKLNFYHQAADSVGLHGITWKK